MLFKLCGVQTKEMPVGHISYQEYSNRYDREHGGVPDACKSDEIER